MLQDPQTAFSLVGLGLLCVAIRAEQRPEGASRSYCCQKLHMETLLSLLCELLVW
jgi:hypothetical protein